MKKHFKSTIAVILITLFSLPVMGQQKKKTTPIDIRVGVGYSILGSGDILTFNYINELNYKLNPYFTTSFSMGLGRSLKDGAHTASYTQGNLNIFLSPFKNNKRNDFRIGAGLTYYGISGSDNVGFYYENGASYDHYDIYSRRSSGFNVIFEDSFLVTQKILVGVKLYSQPYFNGDINTGVLIKMGLKL
jgi:hypothetical protein